MRSKKPILHMVLLVYLALLATATAQEVQAPIDEEAYGVLKAFYDYDAEIPLEASAVKWDILRTE